MRKLVVLACPVLAAALIGAGVSSGSPAGFYEAKGLEKAASYVARKPVKVYCATSAASWDRYLAAVTVSGDPVGLAVPGSSVARLSALLCDGLANVEGLKTYATWQTLALAVGIETVTHEAIHLRGESDEGVTDCDAMHEMPGVAVRFFDVRAGKRLRALMAQAWLDHNGKAEKYRTIC